MATITRPTTTTLPVYRLTVRQFERMISANVFPEGDHVELLGGILVDKMTKHQPHNFTVGQAADSVRRVTPHGWHVIEEKSVALGRRWRPEPDLAVIRGDRTDYPDRLPGPGDIVLSVEVADTTYATDRGVKWRRYAAARVPIYGIINLPTRRVEVYSDPVGRGKTATYRVTASYGVADEVPVVIEGREVGRIAVKDIFLP